MNSYLKRTMIMTAIAVAILMLTTGCSEGPVQSLADKNAVKPDNTMIRIEDNAGNYEIWMHRVTGCYYISTGNTYGGFTLMQSPTGKPYCPGE